MAVKRQYFFKLLSFFLACHSLFIVSAHASEGIEIISEVNKAYYNLKQLGLQEFKCEVNSTAFEQLKDILNAQFSAEDSRIKAFNSLRFYLIFDQTGEFRFESTTYKPTGNIKFDLGIMQIIDDTRGIVLDFCGTWRDFIIEPIFEEMDLDYTIEKTYKRYDISYKEDKADITKSVDNDFSILQTLFALGSDVYKVIPNFTQSNHGLLFSGYNININNGSVKMIATIDYQEIEGLQMLKRVAIQSVAIRSQQNIEFSFSNFHVIRK